jgi:predicted DNA-binding transcriptional regulator YafY
MQVASPLRIDRAPCESSGRSAYESLRLPLVRLLQLVMILQGGRYPNARRLAEACAVSRRTIYRDLAILEAAGLRVDYHPDRQGYRLADASFLQPMPLDEDEAMALVLLSRLAPPAHPFHPLREIRGGVDKVIQTLPQNVRDRVCQVGDMVAGDPTLLELPTERRTIYEAIWWAIRQRRKVRLSYREHPADSLSTKVSIYRLTQVRSCWSIVGRSTWHRDVHLFRIPGIHRVEPTDESYVIPPRFCLERWLARSNGSPDDPSGEVHLRFTPRAAPAIRDGQGPAGRTLHPLTCGGVDLILHAPLPEDLVPWILGFGDQVEVLRPDRVRDAVRNRAEQIARFHARAYEPLRFLPITTPAHDESLPSGPRVESPGQSLR